MSLDIDKLQADVKSSAKSRKWSTREPGVSMLDEVRSDARYNYLKRLRNQQLDREYEQSKQGDFNPASDRLMKDVREERSRREEEQAKAQEAVKAKDAEIEELKRKLAETEKAQKSTDNPKEAKEKETK